MKRRSPESGFVFALAAILIPGLLLLMFACIQIVNGTGEAIWNYYRGVQTVEQMQSNIPSEQGAYDAAAWVAILNDFDGAAPNNTTQSVTNGTVKFTYSTATSPHTVTAYYKRDLPLLAHLFAGVLSTLGLAQLEAESQSSGSSFDAAALLHVDVSDSMRGAPPTGTSPSIIDNLLDKYQVPKYAAGSHWGLCCWPIDVGDTTYGDRCTDAQREKCYEYRRMLPSYYWGTPQPVWLSYYSQRPGPQMKPYDPIFGPFNPYQTDGSPAPGPYFMLGDDPNPGPDGMGGTITDPGRYTWSYYNPSIDYRSYAPPGDNLLICGIPWTGTQLCIPGSSSPSNCFPWGPNPVLSQFLVNRPGFRIVDYLMSDPSDPTNPTKSCGFGTLPCQRSSVRYITDRGCVMPWVITNDWATTEEITACAGGGAPNELPIPGGCATQLGALYYHMDDFWEGYKRMVQGFFISTVDLVNITNLSVFAGPVAAGNLANTIYGSNPPTRLGGDMTIFDGIRDGGHPFVDEIDQQLYETKGVTLEDNNGHPVRIGTNLNYLPGFRRVSGVQPHLPRDRFPLLNPDPSSTIPVLAANTAYQGFRAFSPIQHPNYPYVNNPGPYLPASPPAGRCGTWQGQDDGSRPYFYDYSFPNNGDITPTNPTQFFPPPGGQQVSPILEAANLVFHNTWKMSDDPNGAGIFDWPSLKQIDYQTGQTLTTAYQTEDVNTFASCAMNYISPTMGGTDHWAVFKEIADSTQVLKENRTPPGGDAHDETTPVIGVVFTDGKPNLPCSQAVLDSWAWSDKFTCDPIPFGSISTVGSHMYHIKEELDRFKSYKNTFVVVLFMISDPALLSDPEFIAFKDLFENDPEGKSAFLYFVFTDTQEFQTKFARALEILKALMAGITKFV